MTSPIVGASPVTETPGLLSPYGDCLFWQPHLVSWLWVGHVSKALALLMVIGVIIWVIRQIPHRPQLRIVHWQIALLLLLVAITNIVELFKLYYVAAIYWSIAFYNVAAVLALVMAFNLPLRIRSALRERTDK